MYYSRHIKKKLTLSIILKRVALLIGVFSLLFFIESNAQISTRKLEAIYMYNFTKYINWQNHGNAFTIGVLNENKVTAELSENLQNKDVKGKPIQVQNISLAEVKKCQILYIPKVNSGQLQSILEAVQNTDVLVVAEEDLAEQGASVSFFIDGSKLKFKINKDALDKAGLQASSNLLSLAVVI